MGQLLEQELGSCALVPPLLRNPTDSAPQALSRCSVPFGSSGITPRKLINERTGLGYRALDAGPSVFRIVSVTIPNSAS